jgi:hypothetical protein
MKLRAVSSLSVGVFRIQMLGGIRERRAYRKGRICLEREFPLGQAAGRFSTLFLPLPRPARIARFMPTEM